VAVLVSSFWLPGAWKYLALAGQAGIYGLALSDNILPDNFGLKRLSSPANTFVVLMAAAVAGASVLFVSPNKLWRQTR
jgi:hypothetical protein